MTSSPPTERTRTTRGGSPDLDAEGLLGGALGLAADETPFPWQTRLLARFREGEIPRSLDIPTGLGKTATIAIWLVARSLGAPLPRRLVYVVDRRAVVDQATKVASDLREWVSTNEEVRRGLGLDDRELPVSTLRGKLVDNREWLEDPAAPAVLVGTVDMIGSRLLFEGYGASRKIRPYMAGLLGHDTLFVIDEAHLVPPFERLLERITLDRADLQSSQAALADPPAPRLLSLSATGRSRGGEAFDLDDPDTEHPVVARRLRATKRLLVEPLDAKVDLAVAAADRAWELAGKGSASTRCIVFLDRREDAEKTRDRLARRAGLDKLKKGQEPTVSIELLVGARRVFERQEAAEKLSLLGFLAGDRARQPGPAFLVATSAGEVGVDLDADHMVCDLVAWERMVQRLGRVNRRGLGEARVVVLDPATEAAEPAYADRRQSVRMLFEALPAMTGGGRDASPGALRNLQRASREDRELAALIYRASSPDPLYPALDRPTIDAWSMTSLRHHPGRPLIAPWLRGWIDDRPRTVVVWRRYLPLEDGVLPDDNAAERYFEAAPVHVSEVLETETFRVTDWLNKRMKKCLAHGRKPSDASAAIAPGEIVAATRRSGDEAFRWWTLRQIAEASKRVLERELSGATLVLHADLAGLSHGLLDHGSDEAPVTLDAPGWIDVGYRVRETAESRAVEDALWRERERFPRQRATDGEVSRWLVVEKRRQESATEEDRSSGPPQHLAVHQSWTAARGRALACRLGLSDEAGRILEIAGRLHDEGKRAERWQTAFNAPTGGPYAKTLGPVNVRLLDGYRHELGSLPYAEGDPEVRALRDSDRELVLHLIASHHGFARPAISTSGCDDAPPSALVERARQVALRFWRLQERWGPWGLAWWEALLRAADQQASRENDARDDVRPEEA